MFVTELVADMLMYQLLFHHGPTPVLVKWEFQKVLYTPSGAMKHLVVQHD